MGMGERVGDVQALIGILRDILSNLSLTRFVNRGSE